ncbi:MAG: ParB/RepB/Spo0J family partition protein [Alphaproteobacteria bacterium]
MNDDIMNDDIADNPPQIAAAEGGARGRRPSLGRGLAALFGESGTHLPSEAGGAHPSGIRSVPIEAIRPSPFQPRRHFAEEELEGLAQSIRGKGIVQPLLVRPVEDNTEGGADYELVAGERRWRAAQRVGLHEVPVLVRGFSDSEVIEIALVENLQRQDLSALEEAEAYSRLMREFGRSQASLAEIVGKSRSHVANTVRLLSLPEPVRRSLEEGALSAGHARALLGAPDPVSLAEDVVRRGLNVRATETLVRRRLAQPAPRPKPARDADTLALERDLSATLGLRVTLTPRSRGGSLTLHYASLDQLDRILAMLRRP